MNTEEKDNELTTSMFPNLASSFYSTSFNISESLSSAYKSTIKTISEIKTNLAYNVKHSEYSILPTVQRKQVQLRNDGSKALLLGKEYTFQFDFKFLYVFRNTFWFSYRKDIEDIESDNGWGCMIRTVQMLFAEAFKRHLELNQSQEDHQKIIKIFTQMADGPFSLARICSLGNIDKRWTSSLQVFSVFKMILDEQYDKFNLYFEVYASGVIFKDKSALKLKKYPAIISISNRVGLNNINEDLHPHYFHLMSHPCFIGNIGGITGQALYILGHYDQKVIFLDPHYVQSNESGLLSQTYFSKTPRGISVSALSPSVSFCYYFKNQKQHMAWVTWISNSCETFYPNLIFELISQEQQAKAIEKRSKDEASDQFQIL